MRVGPSTAAGIDGRTGAKADKEETEKKREVGENGGKGSTNDEGSQMEK